MNLLRLLSLLVCAAMAGLCCHAAVEARIFQKKDEKGKDDKGKSDKAEAAMEAELKKALAILEQSRTTLEKADHDYGGHRADAIRDVTEAERQVKQALGTSATTGSAKGEKGTKEAKSEKGGKGEKGSKGGKESQANSNASLSKTVPALKDSIGVLNKAEAKDNAKRLQLVKVLTQAFEQLQTAVKFEKSETPAKKK